MKRVRTKSSDKAGNMEPPKKPNRRGTSDLSSSPNGLPSPIDTSINGRGSPARSASVTSGIRSPLPSDTDVKLSIRIISHGRAHGPIPDPDDNEEMLKFSVRDVANPPAKLRKTYTGSSPRLRKEIFSDKAARAKYDLIVTETEKMMKAMDTAMGYDEAHKDEEHETATVLIVSIECEEGKHRSVAYADELGRSVGRKGWGVSVEHRDLGISEVDGLGLMGDEEDDLDEPLTPSSPGPKESVKAKKKKDKNLKKKREQRLRVEVGELEAGDGYM